MVINKYRKEKRRRFVNSNRGSFKKRFFTINPNLWLNSFQMGADDNGLSSRTTEKDKGGLLTCSQFNNYTHSKQRFNNYTHLSLKFLILKNTKKGKTHNINTKN